MGRLLRLVPSPRGRGTLQQIPRPRPARGTNSQIGRRDSTRANTMTDNPAPNTVYALLLQQARVRGSAPAIIDPDRRSLSYADLQQEVERFGAMLGEIGLGPGSRIAVALPS